MKGTIAVTPALVLSRRFHRETDRVAVLYTRELGKIGVRFVGVERPRGKLKALSEPMVLGEYRLYIRDGAEFAVAAGGKLITAYPGLRSALGPTLRGLEVCELLDRMTPPLKPNPEKYDLAARCLTAMESGAGPGGRDLRRAAWLMSAFALRLLESAGYGMSGRRVSESNKKLWNLLHDAPLDEVAAIEDSPARRARLESFLRDSIERLTERPLNCALVAASVGAG